MTPAETWDEWLAAVASDARSGITPADLAALTGQDSRALAAVDALWLMYARADDMAAHCALAAIAALVRFALRPQARPCARALVARALDWGDIDVLWPRVTP